jgi:hypothetical protein
MLRSTSSPRDRLAASPFTFTPSATPGRSVARLHDWSVGAYAADIARRHRQDGGRRADMSDDHEVSADRDRREPASPSRTTKLMGQKVQSSPQSPRAQSRAHPGGDDVGDSGGGGGGGGAAGTTVARPRTSPGGGGGGGGVAATSKAAKGGGSLAQRLEQFREARHRRDRGH